MIARCPWCDHQASKSGSLSRCGYRYDTRRASLKGHHCGYCCGPLRPKRKGETESNIVDARLGAPLMVRKVPA